MLGEFVRVVFFAAAEERDALFGEEVDVGVEAADVVDDIALGEAAMSSSQKVSSLYSSMKR